MGESTSNWEVHVLIGLGGEVLRRLSNDMTIEHLKEMEDIELQRLTEQLWRWHDEALRELLKRGHVVPQQRKAHGMEGK
jgi:hypothetical protein